VDQELESRFLLDPATTEREKRRREREFHLVEVPLVRVSAQGCAAPRQLVVTFRNARLQP